ncbi:MAG: acetamidase/formamidase family protein [Tissierellaceae bacterium]|nr:acetamidase/formamidase family protein [Tissierellaceae bacterium]
MKVIKGDKVIYKFTNEMDYINKVNCNERFVVETNDCFFQQVKDENITLNELDYDCLNPATGPLFVQGAEPGDLLKVEIINIEVADKGVTMTVPGEGVLGDQATKSRVKILPIEDNHALFNGIKIPIVPMIGVIGVAPNKEDGEWPTATPWKHGGNMDTTDIKAGSTLYFSVHQKGALLALGDCHAVMGDGEICFTGLEIPAKVTLEVDIIKNKTIKWPLVETEEATMVIASGDSVDDAIYEASSQAVNHIKNGLNFDFEDAYILASLVMDLKISQVVDPKVTIRAAIPKNILSTDDLLKGIR